MVVNKLLGTVLAGALLSCAGWNLAHAQAPAKSWGAPGTSYALHSNAAGDCPAMDWHIVRGDAGKLTGMVAMDDMKTVFRLTGTIEGANFHMDGTELNGTRTGSLNGQLQSDGRLAMTLGGLPVGSACQGKTVYIKFRIYNEMGGGT